MKRVLLRAPVLTLSGYGVHSRQVFEWLETKNIDLTVECLNWGQTPWLLNGDIDDGLVSRIMSHSKKVEPPYDVSFQLQLPDEWDPKLAKYNVGMSAVVETDKCNPKWVQACNLMDEIVVPSNFTKNVVKKSGVLLKKITTIPEWFNQNMLAAKPDNYLNLKTDFNFLIISQLNSISSDDDRKNIFNTIKWVCEEFKDENVGVVLKTNFGKNTTIDKSLTKNILSQMLSAIGKKQFPKIYLVHGEMNSKDVTKLYFDENVNCLVSATRGEGYGLPLIDAAASALPVVATNWSGHLDFLGDSFTKVDYVLSEIRKEKVDDRIFLEGLKWAEPSETSFKTSIREVYENLESKKELANSLKEKTVSQFTKTKIINLYNQNFDRVLN